MAINLSAPPHFCVGCTNAKLVAGSSDNEYLRCVAPEAPAVGVGRAGAQFISEEIAEKARPYASSMRADPDKCGTDARWFKAKEPASV